MTDSEMALHPLSSIANDLDRQGLAVVAALIDGVAVQALVQVIEQQLMLEQAAGLRGLAARVPEVATLAASPCVRDRVCEILGADATLVRSVLFNKDATVNWHVGWHQDLAIPVRARVDTVGFSSWTVKDGVPHVQPPLSVLQQMLTVRIHLDATDDANGALWVAPGSHHLGRVPAEAAAQHAEKHGAVVCEVQAGDALLLRPLLLHASRKVRSARPRRIVHLEFAAAELPPPLAWNRELS